MENLKQPPVRIRQIEGVPPRFVADELARIATTYARVFAGSPWYEVSRCRDDFSPEPVGSQCNGCGDVRTEAYPLEAQKAAILGEMNRPDAACFVLEDEQNNDIVGFSWGFAYENVDEFIEEKYAGDGQNYEQLCSDVRRALGNYAIGGRRFYYLSETGIIDDARYRGRGISKELTRLRCEIATERGLDIVQRTSIDSPMYRTMQSAGFTQIMGTPASAPDRVNPQRVLFAKKA